MLFFSAHSYFFYLVCGPIVSMSVEISAIFSLNIKREFIYGFTKMSTKKNTFEKLCYLIYRCVLIPPSLKTFNLKFSDRETQQTARFGNH